MTRNRATPVIALTTLALTIAALTGCSGASSGASADRDIVIGQVAEPESAPDPIMDGSLAGYNYYYNVFDQLTKLDADGVIEPSLATEWTPSADLTTWTFTLRDDAVFSNGDPVTAGDVAFTYNTILTSPDSDNLGYMGVLQSVEATDDTTVVFTLNAPFSPWPSITTAISIVPETVYTELGSEGFAAAPVGSGPFRFVSYTRGVEYVIERNPDYWGEEPEVEKVTFQTVGDSDARLNGVSSGSLDIALISPNQVDSLSGSGVDVASRTANGVTFLGMNSSTGVLADARVRQAIWLAIDKQSLVDGVLSGRAVANDQIVAPDVTGYADIDATEYDPEAAEALLAEAGYAGETIPLQYATEGRIPLSSEIAQAIGGYLEAVGMTVELKGTDQASLSNIIYGTVSVEGLYLNTWAPSTMDGDMPATNLFAGGQNDYAKSPELAALVEEQRTVTGDERAAVFAEIAQTNIDNAFIDPLFTPDADYAVAPGIEWTPRADGEYVLSDVTFTD
ncbi:ABC transporter substrate-binding protein [Rathayibacter oskolensis]|uniref:ABC transporter substrate-binding protein n=1 Tax=Rathayibacter oskolensis TaxID=1891671 RepID=UPI0026600700|nr:ABC transporter substrate-binding protein [Rathayibacter oskolensis]WKK72547.1 ABC transporter substrate-binding protein [Rathayibacter oskolensis]